MTDRPLFFLSAAEPSGDALGAALIGALRQEFPDGQFTGIGGPKMIQAGCRVWADPTGNSAMLAGAVLQARYWWRLLRQVRREFATHPPDLVVPIDSPTVNVRLSRLARRRGITVCYYVAPQLWAWAPWRIKAFAAAVDHLCCILPFEEDYFRRQGVPTTYVGHPLFDQPADGAAGDPAQLKPALPAASLKIALLPGSRRAEIIANLPPMLEAVRALHRRFPGSAFAAAAVDDARGWQIRGLLQHSGLRVDVRSGVTDAIIRWADVVLTVSGTATLQVARHHKPMLVMYTLAWWKWNFAGRFLVQTRYLSLVNILAGRELVPEFIPFHGSLRPLLRRAGELLSQPQQRTAIARELGELVAPFEAFSRDMPAARRVALEIARLRLSGSNQRPPIAVRGGTE